MHRAVHRAWQLALLASVFACVLAASALAAGGADYIVRLKAPPLAGYTGGSPGLAPTSPRVTGQKLTRGAPAVVAYQAHLADLQQRVLGRLGSSAPNPIYSYRFALAGFAARLEDSQVAALRHDPQVASVDREQLRHVTPTTGPQADALLGGKTGDGASYLGLPTGLWQRLGGVDHAGENVIVGVLDTGITPEHPSFADNGKGYIGPAYKAPAVWDGACQAGDGFPVTDCNNKLIGARYFVDGFGVDDLADDAFVSPRDDDGHGSHTASTAAGNFGVDPVIDGNDLGVDRISGIAPRAYVAMYKVCWPGGAVPDGCSTVDIVRAVDAAIADGVDVINFSIGSPGNSVLDPDGLAFLSASDAGVYVATSAGNDGPGDETVGSPTGVPWVTSVAAATLSRSFEATATITKGSTTLSVRGASVTNALPAAPLVDAAVSGAAGVPPAAAELCLPGALDPAKVTGKVVLCKRGNNARVDKSKNVKDAGGVGMILYNVTDPQELVTDTHWVPSVHINNTDGLKVKALAGDGATAAISAGKATPLSRGGVLAAFSSRGPQSQVPDIPKPDVTAPGVNILAAASPFPSAHTSLRPGQLFQSISGTSMASPHVAGAAALLTQLHPTWSPASIKSSLMTSANPDVLLEDGQSPAGPFAAGSGEIAPNAAADPGLVLDAATIDYLGYLKGQEPECKAELGVDCLTAIGFGEDEIASIPAIAATDVNLPAISNAKVAGTLSTSRRFTSVDATAQRWVVTVEGLDGVDAVPSPRRFTITPGQSQDVDFTFTVAGAPLDEYTTGAVVLRNGSRTVRLPVSLKPTAVAAPARVVVDAGADGGSTPLTGVQAGYSGPFSAAGWGLAAPDVKAGETITGSSEAPDLSGNDPGTNLYKFTVPEGAQLLAEKITNADGGAADTDLDLYLFRDSDGNGSYDEPVASSGTSGSNESIEHAFPDPGNYVVAVVGFSIHPGGSTYDLTQWLVADPQPDDPAPAPGLTITGDPVDAVLGQPVPLTLNWSAVAEPGTYLGVATYHQGATPTADNQRAYSIVELHRGAGGAAPPVIPGSASPSAAAPTAPPAEGADGLAATADPALTAPSVVTGAATARPVAVRSLRLTGRTLVVTLDAKAPGAVKVAVLRQTKLVARTSAKAGVRSVRVRMARRLRRGTYMIRVTSSKAGRPVVARGILKVR
jgi:subtilisin family serine protease